MKKKGIDIAKTLKKLSREIFKDVNMVTKVKPSKKIYKRKPKHKEN